MPAKSTSKAAAKTSMAVWALTKRVVIPMPRTGMMRPR